MARDSARAALLDLISDRKMTVHELVDEGACLIINGMPHALRSLLDLMVKDGVLRKVKVGRQGRKLGGRQFCPRKCLLAFERVKAP